MTERVPFSNTEPYRFCPADGSALQSASLWATLEKAA